MLNGLLAHAAGTFLRLALLAVMISVLGCTQETANRAGMDLTPEDLWGQYTTTGTMDDAFCEQVEDTCLAPEHASSPTCQKLLDGCTTGVPPQADSLDDPPASGDGGLPPSSDTGGPPATWYDISLKSSITKVQPMTGIVMWEDSWNDDPIKTGDGNIQLEYAYVKPSSIVTGKSTYDWSSFDQFLDRIKGRKHQAIPRFYYTYPGKQTAVPSYIKQLSDYDETVGTSEGSTTWFPDWSHPELERFHLEFYSEFAARYDDDPRIAFLQTGFGLWGEYHIYDGPNTLGQQFPSKAFQTQFLSHLGQVLKTLHWSISIDAGDSQYSPFSSDPALLQLVFGNFDDSFMHQGHSGYNESMWDFFDHTERYKHAPHGGELSYYSDYDQEHALDAGGMYGRTYEQLSATFHITYMIGNDQPSYQSVDRIREASMANGYRFEIVSLRASSTQSKVQVKNTGIAPIYYDAYVTINGVRAADSLKGLLPGETQEFLINAGGTSPTLTIECDRLVPGQEIQYEANL